jgi:hypothetical protein
MKHLYKFTGRNGETYNGFMWPLPVKQGRKWIAGEWTPAIDGELEACENGYHLTDRDHLLEWAGEEMYVAEYDGDIIQEQDKYVVRRARLIKRVETWNDKTLRLFTVWCARNALAFIDNPDPRSVHAVDVAEKFANGKATGDRKSVV